MKRNIFLILITIWILGMTLCSSAFAQCVNCGQQEGKGTIEGSVLTAEGRPVTDAKVYIQPSEGLIHGRLPTTYTDAKGHFVLKGIMYGSYVIHSVKEDEGYPDTFFSFFTDDQQALPVVNLDEQDANNSIVLKLGKKWSKVLGQITDAKTGKPIKDATVILYRIENPNSWVSINTEATNGHFQSLAPYAFKIKVTALGYRDWYYGESDTQEKSAVFTLLPNTTQEIYVSLQPIEVHE